MRTTLIGLMASLLCAAPAGAAHIFDPSDPDRPSGPISAGGALEFEMIGETQPHPASEPFEIKIRCAELLARVNLSNNMSNDEIEKLAKSKDWRDRLVAGNMARDLETDFGQSIRESLAEDDFQDDNGFFLVREAIGVESE